MPELSRSGDVFVLHLGEGDLRFTPTLLAEVGAALDTVESSEGPTALVTAASGKIWHNGLDLGHLADLGDGFGDYVGAVEELFARFLSLPVVSIAAIQGHAFAGGAMLAMSHDIRIMRADRGFLCLPEVDLGMPFTPGMAALLAAKLPQPALHRMAVLGERIGGVTAAEMGVVDDTVDCSASSSEAVAVTAVERARTVGGKAGTTLAALRRNFYSDAIDALSATSRR